MRINKLLLLLILECVFCSCLMAQQDVALKTDMARLNTFHSVLFIGTNPDDIDTALARFYYQNKNYRVGFLSVTRGENTSIDSTAQPFSGIQRGLYQTYKAHAHIGRLYDHLYFTRAYDVLADGREDSAFLFGQFWNADEIESDLVWCIRTFQPDEIIISNKYYQPIGKLFYAHELIQKACAKAADSAAFPIQFDDGRYPWKPEMVHIQTKTLSENNGNPDSSLFRIINKEEKKENPLNWSILYPNEDYIPHYVDSIAKLTPPNSSAAWLLFQLRAKMQTLGYENAIWYAYKKMQVDRLLMKYTGVKISTELDQAYLVLGNPYKIRIHYATGDTLMHLQRIRFGNFDTTTESSPYQLSLAKQMKLSSEEQVYQPYWLAAQMETSGMYDIGTQQNLDQPLNVNPFIVQFSFKSEQNPLTIESEAYFLKEKKETVVKEIPVITLPAFENIRPSIILKNLIPRKTNENITVQLQSNFTENRVPVTVRLFQKQLVLRSALGNSNISERKVVGEKDSIVDFHNGKTFHWNFPVKTASLSSTEPSINAEVLLNTSRKIKINSSLNAIPLDSLPDINYHFQPAIRVIVDSVLAPISGKIAIVDNGIYNRSKESVEMALTTMHVPYDLVTMDSTFTKDSLQKYAHLILTLSSSIRLDSLLPGFVSNGGNLIILPSENDSLPTLLKELITIQHIILRKSQPNLSLQSDESSSIITKPNRIKPDYFTQNEIISDFSFQVLDSSVPHTSPLNFHIQNQDIRPLVTFKIGKGTVVVNGFYGSSNALENAFFYQLLANILAYK